MGISLGWVALFVAGVTGAPPAEQTRRRSLTPSRWWKPKAWAGATVIQPAQAGDPPGGCNGLDPSHEPPRRSRQGDRQEPVGMSSRPRE